MRDLKRFFVHLFPGVVGMHPSSLHRRVRKLRGFLKPLRREILPELVGEPETMIVDSTLLEVLQSQAGQTSRRAGGGSSTGARWAKWGSFAVYGVKLHLLCATNRVPALLRVNLRQHRRRAPCAGAVSRGRPRRGGLRRDSWQTWPTAAANSERSWPGLGILLATEKANRRPPIRQQVEVCFAMLKRVFGMDATLAKTLTGLVTRIAAKVTAYTYGCYINRLLGRPQGRIKELWA